LVEFEEKKRAHVGRITDVVHKSNGGARYDVEVYPTGQKYSVADKEVTFSVPAPNNDKQVQQLLKQLEKAHALAEKELLRELDISPELLEMAWEEKAEDEEVAEMKAGDLVELVHSHKPNQIEKYEAWRLMRSEIGHVFFKDVKENGRVVAFKPKPASAVETSKGQFCASHDDVDEICDVEELRP